MIKLIDVIGKNFALKNTFIKINGVKVTIKTFLSSDDYISTVRLIVDTCFENGEYHAEYREIAKRFAILKYFTDIQVDDDNVMEIFKVTQGGTWFEDIQNEVSELPIWSEIESAVDHQIESMLLTRKTAFDNLCDTLNSNLTGLVEGMNNIDMETIKRLVEKLNNIDDKTIVKTIVQENNLNTEKKSGDE